MFIMERDAKVRQFMMKSENCFSNKVVIKGKYKYLRGGCKCKNSGCLRKYCACFKAGVRCTNQCCCD